MRRLTVLILAATVVLTGCQSASEVLTEQIIEQAEGVDNVEIDADTGQIKVETDDGSLSIGGGELPDDFAVPVPDGGEVMSTFSSPEGASVSLVYPIDRYDELVMFYSDWTASQPGEWNSGSSTFESGGQTIRTSSWFGYTGSEDVNIAVTDCVDISGGASDYNAACVNVITN